MSKQAFEAGVFLISASGHGNLCPLAVEFAVFVDELRGIRPIVQVCGNTGALHAGLEVEPDFEMKMRGIMTVGSSDGADLLAAFDLLPFLHQDFIQMAVERINDAHLPRRGIAKRMPR